MSRIYEQKMMGFLFLCVLAFVGGFCSKKISSDPGSRSHPSTEDIIITFASVEQNRYHYEPFMEEFHREHPSITVQFVTLSETDTSAKDDLELQASVADTSLLWAGTTDTNVVHFFRDLLPLVKADPKFEPNDFWPGLLTACQDANGHSIGIPLHVSINGIFFDKGTFDAVGYPYPVPGWTLDDFKQTAATLAHENDGVISYGFVDQSNLRQFILALIIDAHLVEMNGKIDAEKLALDLQWYSDLAESRAIEPLRAVTDWVEEAMRWDAMFENTPPGNVGRTLIRFDSG